MSFYHAGRFTHVAYTWILRDRSISVLKPQVAVADEEDMRHGYGTYTFPSGAKYEGCWFMGKRHGQVCCVMK